jgi:DNA modification methylase
MHAHEEPAAEWVDIEKLRPWDKNPRVNDHVVADLVDSVERFGFGAPLLVRRADGEIIAGHTRLKAAQKLGLKQVPVRYMDLSAEEAHLLALADNRLSEKADWSVPDLHELLSGYDTQSVELAGWSADDMKLMLEQLGKSGGAGGSGEVVEDEAPEPPKVPVTKLGDVWQLGDSVLVCGDCTNGALDSFADGGAKLLITDPPYGVDYGAKNARLNALDGGKRIETAIENDALSPAEMQTLWVDALRAAARVLAPGAAYYVTGPQGGDLLYALMSALREAGYPLRHMLVWVKNNHALSAADYHYKHEPILYGWREGAAHHRVDDRSQMSTWEIDRPQKADLHPTMKPVELYARAMRNSSNAGDVVLEPFAGSGTAYAAAVQLNRRVWGSELSPAYCDVIVQRWEQLAGRKARRTQHGSAA